MVLPQHDAYGLLLLQWHTFYPVLFVFTLFIPVGHLSPAFACFLLCHVGVLYDYSCPLRLHFMFISAEVKTSGSVSASSKLQLDNIWFKTMVIQQENLYLFI